MRSFESEDGKTWVARIHDGMNEQAGVDSRTGWEVIQFDSEAGGSFQKISYRPSGWLNDASIQELIDALKEGEAVRTSWK
jgi:hypothetical protein